MKQGNRGPRNNGAIGEVVKRQLCEATQAKRGKRKVIEGKGRGEEEWKGRGRVERERKNGKGKEKCLSAIKRPARLNTC